MLYILAVIVLSTGAAAGLQCSVIPGKLKQIDAGNGQVYGVNDDDSVLHYSWKDKGWTQLPGKLSHVTSGPAGVWGVNKDNNIFRWKNNNWRLVTGHLKQVDAGGRKFISGVNRHDSVYCLNEAQTISTSTKLHFTNIEGSMKYYSCGPIGCWGVDGVDHIYFRHYVTAFECQGGRWEQVPGYLVMVEVGFDGSVYGVNKEGDAYYREGISERNPVGTSWTKLDISYPLKHLSYDIGLLWLVTQKGEIYNCEIYDPDY